MIMLKANELMAGDIICQEFSNLVLVVSAVIPPYVQCIGEEGQFHEKTIKPIPLTPEILEKNGFNVDKYSDGDYYAYIMFEDQGRRVEVEYKYGVDIDVCAIGRNNTPPFSRIETQVRYIHELQHIFRIMQINKEIVL
jgi:hypothetical protein